MKRTKRERLKNKSVINIKDVKVERKERRKESRKKRKLLDLFNLDNISKNSSLFPKIENYSCYIKILNSPTRHWLINNILGSLESNKKKKTINVKFSGKKIEFTTNKIEVWGKERISEMLTFLKKSTIDYSHHKIETLKPKKKYMLKIREFTFKEEFENETFALFSKLKKEEENIKNKNKNIVFILKIDVLHIKGLKNISNIYKIIKELSLVINNLVKTRNLFYDKNEKTTTNILYQLIIPYDLTIELEKLYNNSLNIKWKRYLEVDKINFIYEPDNFSAFMIKFFNLYNHKKTTLQIYDTGYISITGFKNHKRFIELYPYIIYFLYKIVDINQKNFFKKIFEDGSGDIVNKYTVNSSKLYTERKLQQEFSKDELALTNMYNMIKNTGLIYKKSDLKIQQKRYKMRKKMKTVINILNLKKNFYQETSKLLNDEYMSESNINIWLDYLQTL